MSDGRRAPSPRGPAGDDEMGSELLRMLELDQSTRREAKEVAAAHGRQSPEYAVLRERGKAMDARHAARLVEIVDAHGWPGTSRVGTEAGHAAFLLLQHADPDTQRRLLPRVRQAAADGEVRSSDLPLLEDRVRLYSGQPQLYGTQIVRGADGRPAVWAIEDEEHVEERRAAAGMEPLSEYVKRFGAEWPRKRPE